MVNIYVKQPVHEWIAHLQNHGPDIVGYGRDDQHPFHGDDDQVDLVNREADGDCNLGGGRVVLGGRNGGVCRYLGTAHR